MMGHEDKSQLVKFDWMTTFPFIIKLRCLACESGLTVSEAFEMQVISGLGAHEQFLELDLTVLPQPAAVLRITLSMTPTARAQIDKKTSDPRGHSWVVDQYVKRAPLPDENPQKVLPAHLFHDWVVACGGRYGYTKPEPHWRTLIEPPPPRTTSIFPSQQARSRRKRVQNAFMQRTFKP